MRALLPRIDRRAGFAVAGGMASLAAVLWALYPAERRLWLYGLYAIASHTLVSPFPHEPALLEIAKHYPPWVVATTGVVGCLASGVFDYWLLGWALNHHLVQPHLSGSRVMQACLRFFRRAPFAMLWVTALTFPFYPFKFLSIASGYSFWRYEVALLLARWPRFLFLAWLGREIALPGWILLVAALAVTVVVALRMWMAARANSAR